MKILLVSATSFETAPISDWLRSSPQISPFELKIIETGVGVLSTTYLILKEIQQFKPDFILQAGIAGSFDENLPPGSIAYVKQDILADLCVREPDGYRDMGQIGLESTGWLKNPIDIEKLPPLPFIDAVTVNEVSTSADRIEWFKIRFGAKIESMEGAALHYVALNENIPFLQVRSISNYIGERNKKIWKLNEAIEVLNNHLRILIPKLKEIWN